VSWFKTGYEATDHAYDDVPSKGPSRFWVNVDQTERVIILDDDPMMFWEHKFQANGSWDNYEPCKRNNRMENVCAVCDRFPDKRPYFVGLHTIITLTPNEGKDGRLWCFSRKIFEPKLGGKDRPGTLKKLKRLKEQHGHLRGLVIDCYRSGKQTERVGDDITVVEVIEPDAVVAWVKAQLPDHIKRVNERIDDEKKHMTLEKFLKYNPIEPYNFEEIIKPRSNADLLTLLGGPSSSSSGGSGSGQEDNSSDDNALDEDIPY